MQPMANTQVFRANVQKSAKVGAPGLQLVNNIPALAYHFCLNLPAAFTKPGRSLLVVRCIPCMPVHSRFACLPGGKMNCVVDVVNSNCMQFCAL